MPCNTSIFIIGADVKDVQIDFTNDDGSESDLSGNDIMEVHLVDDFNIPYAKYIRPFGSEDGYHELRLPFTSVLDFDVHKEDSANFRPGSLYAKVIFTKSDVDFNPDGYQSQNDNIYMGEVRL